MMKHSLLAQYNADYQRQRCVARARQSGIAVLNAILSTSLLIVLAAGLIFYIQDRYNAIKDNQVATLLDSEATYAQQYLNLYSSAIASNLTPGGSALAIPFGNPSGNNNYPTLTLATNIPVITQSGITPVSFSDVDAYGQRHLLIVKELSDGTYEAVLVSIGGKTLSDSALGDIAIKGGNIGGLIGSATSSSGSSNISGIAGAWSIPVASLAASNGTTGISSGHYAALLNFVPATSSGTVSTYLDRYSGASTAQNTMNTNIIANNNALTNTSQVNFFTGASVSDNASQNLVVTAPAVTISGNLTTNGNQTVAASTVAGNQSIAGNDQVSGGLLEVVGNSTAAAIDYSPTTGAVAGSACSTTGTTGLGTVTEAASGNGKLLGCEGSAGSAVWTALDVGAASTQFTTYFNAGCVGGGTGINWTNNHSGPAAVTMSSGYQSDGDFRYEVYDANGDSISQTAYDAYAQGFGWVQGQVAVVPAGGTISAGATGGVCLAGFYTP